jgi:hypothetical protein
MEGRYTNGETYFHYDKDEFDPEGHTKNGILAEVNAQSLIFPADEDGRDDIASPEELISGCRLRGLRTLHEKEQEEIMQGGMSESVKNRQENQSERSNQGKY